MLSNKWFDTLKWIAQFVLPGLATWYFAFAGIWNLPFQEEIVGTIVAIDVWLAALLAVSNAQYQKVMLDGWKGLAGADMDTIQVPNAPFGMDAFTYNILKWTTLAFLPATAALYFTLSTLWGFPYGEEIVGSVAALTTFMGLLLGVSKSRAIKHQED